MTARCYPCTNGNHTGTNGTGGCKGHGCPCPCNANTTRKTATTRLVPCQPRGEDLRRWKVRHHGQDLGYVVQQAYGLFGEDWHGNRLTCWYVAPKAHVRDLVVAKTGGHR